MTTHGSAALFFTLFALGAAGCSAGPSTPAAAPEPNEVPAPAPAPSAAETSAAETSAVATSADAGAPEAKRCTSRNDCSEHERCAGPAGCDAAWACVPEGPCTRDLVTFCGCNGKTFSSSSSCPSAPYRAKGPCGG